MKVVALCLLLGLAAIGIAAEAPSRPWVVPGLELPEPVKRERPGLVKMTAKVEAKTEQKVKVVFDVESVFEDADVTAEWEVREDGRTVQIVVPDSRGIINVTAVAVIDGEPTRFCKSSIEVDYKPRVPVRKGEKNAPEKQEAPKQAKAKVTDVYVVMDVHADQEDVVARFSGVNFKNRLARIGVVGTFVPADKIEAKKLRKYVEDAGGTPCLLYLVRGDKEEELKVRRGRKLDKATAVDEILKEVAE